MMMRLSSLLVGGTCINSAFSQSLQQAIASRSDLSGFADLISPYLSTLSSYTNITVLAPNNAAVSAFLNSSAAANIEDSFPALLSYHVLQGNYSRISNPSFVPSTLQPGAFANVTGGQKGLGQEALVNASLPFNNGSILIMNQFLSLPQNIPATGVALNLTAAVGALTQLNLMEPITQNLDMTCLIPSNEAFELIGGNLANLSTAQLTQIISYHVLAAPLPIYSDQLVKGTVTTMQGVNITVHTDTGGVIYVNNARVIQANVLVANGVIHVIDQVLNPSNATRNYGVAFASASAASNVPFTSGVPTPSSSINTASVLSTTTATSSSGTGTASGSGSASSASESPTSRANVGAIAGGVIAGVVGLALIILLIWWCRRKGYSLSVKLDQKPKAKDNPTMHNSTPMVKDSDYNDKPELVAKTGPVVARPELSGQGRHVAEMDGPTYGGARTPELTAASETGGGGHGSAQLSHSDTARFREVESGFGPVEAEHRM